MNAHKWCMHRAMPAAAGCLLGQLERRLGEACPFVAIDPGMPHGGAQAQAGIYTRRARPGGPADDSSHPPPRAGPPARWCCGPTNQA